jgi:hypothetical protein
MGLVSDSFSGTLEGHTITVEARTGPIAGRFALKVDGEVQDAIKAVNGEHWLDGQLPAKDNAPSRPFRVKIIVKGAGLFGEEYSMLLDGEERKLGQGWIL